LAPIAAVGLAGYMGWGAGAWLNQFEGVQNAAQWVAELSDKIFNWTGNQDNLNIKLDDSTKSITEIRTEAMKGALLKIGVEIDSDSFDEVKQTYIDYFIEPKTVAIDVEAFDANQALKDLGININAIPDEMFLRIMAAADVTEVKTILLELTASSPVVTVGIDIPEVEKEKIQWMKEVDGVMIPVEIEVDKAEVQKIEEVKKDLKTLQMEAKIRGEFDIEAIKQSGETAREAIKMKASIDTAQIKADADTIIALAGSMSSAFSSTGDVLSSIFGNVTALADAGYHLFQITNFIEREYDLQEKLIDSQIEMNEVWSENMRAKTDALGRGDSLITVSGDNLAPHLEAMMWEVFAAIQIRVAEEGLPPLLGV